MRRVATDHRLARIGAGLSLRDVATASGTSHSRLWRFEHGTVTSVSIAELGAWCAVVGLDLALRTYPAGDAIRDRAQLALLERFRATLHPSLRWRVEVPLPIDRDLRAWDADVHGTDPAPWRARVEAETRVADAQSVERKIGLKLRDDPHGHVILLVADTRTNRRVLATLRTAMRDSLPLDSRQLLRALRAGQDPGGSGIVML